MVAALRYTITAMTAVSLAQAPFVAIPAQAAHTPTSSVLVASSLDDATSTGGVMQVVAHQDDDLFFMNPDLDRSIAAKLPSVTVYLTAGEITGDGETAAERARNRQRGAQNAYAWMAGVADEDDTTQQEWEGDTWLVNGKQLERYWLKARPSIRLLFVNLPDDNLQSINTGVRADTVVPATGLVTTSSRYSRADVVGVLKAVMDTYRPTLLRTQDAEPEPGDTFRPGGADHADHVNGTVLAREAATKSSTPIYEVSYRNYNISSAAANLEPAEVTRKTGILERYYRYDHAFKDSHSGNAWLSRQYYRWPRGTNWALNDADGRLQVFVVRSGIVQWYTQAADGGWDPPRQLAQTGGRVAQGLAIGRDTSDRLVVVAHRLSDHHLVTLRQLTPRGQFQTTWADLGTPEPRAGTSEAVGTPAMASNADGRLQVFVRDGKGGVSALAQSATGNGWDLKGWTSLGGKNVQDGLSALVAAQGRIELYASTQTGLLRWYQTEPNGEFKLDSTLPATQPASPPQAIRDGSGRMQVAYLEPVTGKLRLINQVKPDGASWITEPVDLGATGGTGEPAMTLAPRSGTGKVAIFVRNRKFGISASVQVNQDGRYGAWTEFSGVSFEQPAAVTDASGRAIVLVIGTDGITVRTVNGRPASQEA